MLDESRTGEPESAQRADSGFTLVELLISVLVIAVLNIVALPSFFGASKMTVSANGPRVGSAREGAPIDIGGSIYTVVLGSGIRISPVAC